MPAAKQSPDAEMPAEKPEADAISETLARITGDAPGAGERQRLMGRLVGQLAGRVGKMGWLPRPQRLLGAVIDILLDIAERLPVRDLDTLRAHHPGLDDAELAERLVRNASVATAGIGAAGGGVAAVEWVASPTLLSAPVLLTAETIAIAAVELKLIGELHEVYRVPVRGSAVQRATALLTSWGSRRGISPFGSGRGVGAVLSTAARKDIRDRLLRRFGRNLTTLGPMLTGAAVGAELNRRATRSVGAQIQDDLRRRWPGQVVEGAVIPDPVLPSEP